jgi:hypothetical protein
MTLRRVFAATTLAAWANLATFAAGQTPDPPPADAPKTAVEGALWAAFEFATPANARLLTWSRFLGADLATADAALRAQLKLNDGDGYVITGVNPDGAAAEGGLVVYDVVVGLADDPKPEATYPLWVWRQGEKKPMTVKLKAERQGWIGVHLAEIDDALRSQLSLPAGRGLLVQDVTDDSPAKKAGLQLHDVIDGWSDGAPSGNVEEFSTVVRKSVGKSLGVQVFRHGKSMTIHLTPQKRPEQSAAASNVTAAQLRWLALSQVNQQLHPQWQKLDYLNNLAGSQWAGRAARAATLAAQPPSDARQSMLNSIEKQLDQLLSELQAARQSIEEIRKLDERQKDKSAEGKK